LEEYNEYKRQRIYGIYLGFVTDEDSESFVIERMLHTMNLLSLDDLGDLIEFSAFTIDPGSASYEQEAGILAKYANLINTGVITKSDKIKEEDIPINNYSSVISELRTPTESLNAILQRSRSPLRYRKNLHLD
jgi:hypothetical protein